MRNEGGEGWAGLRASAHVACPVFLVEN